MPDQKLTAKEIRTVGKVIQMILDRPRLPYHQAKMSPELQTRPAKCWGEPGCPWCPPSQHS